MGGFLAPERMMTGGHKDTGEYPVAVAALSRKRAEIAGIIADLEKQIAERRNELVCLDKVLLLMNSPVPGEAIPARKPRPKNTGYFVHGELTRRIYEGLRDRDSVTASELADAALAAKGIDDPSVRATFVSRFLVRLGGMALRGHVERIGSGQGVRWRLRRPD